MCATRLLICFVILALVQQGPTTVAQPVAGSVQPDELEFGIVSVGATVEGSVRVFAEGEDAAGVPVSVEPPLFASVGVQVGTQTYGQLGTKTYCDVSVSIRTRENGEFAGKMVVTVRDQRVAIPISAQIVIPDPAAPRVLVVETPFQKFSTKDNSLFDPWRRLVREARLNVDYWEVIDWRPIFANKDLSQFDVILIGETGLIALRDQDVQALVAFAREGGRILVAANYFFRGTADKSNELLYHAGLHLADLEQQSIRQIEVGVDHIADHEATSNVAKLAFFRPSPALVADAERARLLVTIPNSEAEGLVAIGKVGEGEVIALGQSLWWSWIAAEYSKGTDNALLLRNLLTHKK